MNGTLATLRSISANRSRSIRFRIIVLVAMIAIPLTGLSAWIAINYAAAQRELIAARQTSITERVAAAVDQEIASLIGMLSGIALSNDLVTKNFDDFRQQASALAMHPRLLRVWAFDKSGSFVSGNGPSNPSVTPTPLSPEFVARTFKGSTVIGTISGTGAREAKVNIAVPVFNNDRVVYGIAAETRVDQLSDFFAREGLDPQWIAAVVDRNGNFVARSQDAERRVGQAARPELQAAARAVENSGHFENVTWEGVHTVNDFRRSVLTDWTTVVAVPYDIMVAPIRRTIQFLVLIAALILASTLALGSFSAARISDPVRKLSAYAQALATGFTIDDSPHHIDELDEVRVALEQAMAQSARLSAIVASSNDAIISMDLDGTVRTWNGGAQALFGYSADEIVNTSKKALIPPGREKEFEAHLQRILNGASVALETVRRHKDGTLIDVALSAAPIRRANGAIVGISSILHDIRRLKAAEAHTLFLMRELAHRSKNQLAIVQSIAGQTARYAATKDEFIASFRDRIQGLSTSHDLLTNRNGESVPLDELVRRHLEVFVGWPTPRISMSGPTIKLDASGAQAIGLALHELATNAAKYGALSNQTGRVDITWSLAANGGPPQLKLDWRESGGPIVVAPQRKGFGTQVIGKLIESSMSGEAQVDYREDGLHWRFQCPLPTRSAEVVARN